MDNFTLLAEAVQHGTHITFKFKNRGGVEQEISSVLYGTGVFILLNGKSIGVVSTTSADPRDWEIWDGTKKSREILRCIYEETNLEDSVIAPAWKQAIFDYLENHILETQKLIQNANKKLDHIH